MGPGILVKALLQGSFSLMIFGWTQIIMDIQPLIVLLTGEGHLHGFSHTYIGAILLAIFAALTGKLLAEFPLNHLGFNKLSSLPFKHSLEAKEAQKKPVTISWFVTFLSAFIGSFSHVFLDSIMHSDVEPFYPFTLVNNYQGLIAVSTLHKVCLYSGLLGSVIYYFVNYRLVHSKK